MAFSTQKKGRAITAAYQQIQNAMGQVRAAAQRIRDESAAGPIDGVRVVRLCERLAEQRAILVEKAKTPGLATYAAAEMDTSDIAAEFAAIIAQMDATIAWVTSAMPQPRGYLELETLNANGTVTLRTFTPAQTAQLRTVLDALIATID